MVVDTTTTHTLLFGAAIGLSQWIFMSPVALLQLRPCSMDFSSCRKRSTGGRTFSTGGPNKDISNCSGLLCCAAFVMNTNNTNYVIFSVVKRYVKAEII